ncbi:MAG: SDR family NAD(P)-dependent oxidoreductase [Saccharofermentanales bacterium]|jgi:NAD(P)-dependent dehydrogenase (short-subunit alcohol dehydrogenase family)
MRLDGKIAAITGAGSGIGLSSATLFAKKGAKVYVLEIDENSGKEIEQQINSQGGHAKFISTNVANFNSVRSAFQQIEDIDGKLDILYNNASVFWGKKDNIISEISEEVWKRILDINLNGLFHCSKFAIPLMIANRRGSIINTASSAGVIGIPKCDAYTASKGATVSLTRSMAVEYGPKGIRVNCIAPAAIRTQMVKESNLNDPDFDEDFFLTKGTPLRRWGTPEEVANIALFLASDKSSYLNGAIIVADGGITIS